MKASRQKFKRLLDPRFCSLHFKETDIVISISGRKYILSGCYPTLFDRTRVKNTTSTRWKRLDNRKRRCAEQPKVIKGKALRLLRTNSSEKEFKNLTCRAKRTDRGYAENLIMTGRNEVSFFVTDSISLPKMLIPVAKAMRILIREPVFVVCLIPDSLKNTADHVFKLLERFKL